MNNMPVVKLGIIAVSRDCFPRTLSESRRKAVVAAYKGELYECPTIVENEVHMMKALDEVKAAGVNALVVYLGNFGPENPETLIARYFDGPVMYVAAAEENTEVLLDDRGDAYCGMLNCSYNLAIRNLTAYIPEEPVGTPAEIAERMEEFIPIARTLLGLKKLKIFTFGPRPWDFLACNAPIKRLYDFGVEIQENSELDLFQAYKQHEGDARIPSVIDEMAAELGDANKMSGILPRLAQLQITLMDWAEANRGASEYFVFANKCWPAAYRAMSTASWLAAVFRSPVKLTSGAPCLSILASAYPTISSPSLTLTTPFRRICMTRKSTANTIISIPILSWASIAAIPIWLSLLSAR